MSKIRDYIVIGWLICSLGAIVIGQVDKAIFAMAWAIFMELKIIEDKK